MQSEFQFQVQTRKAEPRRRTQQTCNTQLAASLQNLHDILSDRSMLVPSFNTLTCPTRPGVRSKARCFRSAALTGARTRVGLDASQPGKAKHNRAMATRNDCLCRSQGLTRSSSTNAAGADQLIKSVGLVAFCKEQVINAAKAKDKTTTPRVLLRERHARLLNLTNLYASR